MLTIATLTVNHLPQSIGIRPNRRPSFGWELESDMRNTMQTSYRLQIAKDAAFAAPVYDSGVVKTDASQHIEPDIALDPLAAYCWRVQVSDNHGQTSNWASGSFATALPDGEWPAAFISAETEADRDESKGTYLRGGFTVEKPVARATVYATALGIYELYLDGNQLGDLCLTPGWTSYRRRLLYQAYDVTELLPQGEHMLGAMVGAGWYKGVMGWRRERNHYGTHAAFSALLHIEYTDGTCADVTTGAHWQGADSPVLFSEIYDGEIYDAALEIDDWCRAGKSGGAWRPVSVEAHDPAGMVSQEGCFVKQIETIPVKQVITTPQGDTVLDFGQNCSGFVRFSVKGRAGDRVVLRHFEILDAQGNVYTENLRTAKQTVEYRLRGGEVETHRPHFTFQGFRYVHVVSYPGQLDPAAFTLRVIHSDMEPAGEFSCSEPLLNGLAHNILWGLKSNFVDIPTDCPQRDERLGWTGDAQIFGATACYLMNTYPFFSKWLTDVALEQREDGAIPHVVPDILTKEEAAATAWSDVVAILPYDLYLSSGDADVLRALYPTMKNWVRYIYEHSENHTLWTNHPQYGDWVALDAKEGSYHGATPDELVATAYYANTVALTAKTAALLGLADEQAQHQKLHAQIVKAYRDEFYTPTGRLASGTQTAHILSLYFGLTPEQFRERTVADLLKLLRDNDGHLTTGFVGTPYFCRVLADNGQLDAAYDLLLKKDFPSWLYQITMGATTIWEHWDGMKPDGTMWSADMNSFNHYAYGAIGRFLFEVVAGLEADEAAPGYRRSKIHPQPGGGLQSARTAHRSPYGTVACGWEKADGRLTVTVTVPANATASVRLDHVRGVKEADGAAFTLRDGSATAEIGSGSYTFVFEQ